MSLFRRLQKLLAPPSRACPRRPPRAIPRVEALEDRFLPTGSVLPTAPDLVGVSFRVRAAEAAWGETVTADFVIANRLDYNVGAQVVDVVLSNDSGLGESDVLLATFAAEPLAADARASGEVRFALPGSPLLPPAGFALSGDFIVGLRFRVAGVTAADADATPRNSDPLRIRLTREESEDNDSPDAANRLGLFTTLQGTVATPDDEDFYTVAFREGGRLTVRAVPLAGSSFVPQVALIAQDGHELVRADGPALSPSGLLIDHHPGLQGFLRVSAGAGGQTGEYRLEIDGAAVGPAPSPVPVQVSALAALADFNNDGAIDSITADPDRVAVLLGNGDGTFQPAQLLSASAGVRFLTPADIDDDGNLDVVTLNDVGTTFVYLGNGDGSFQLPRALGIGNDAVSVVADDVDRDGLTDLLVADRDGTITVSLGTEITDLLARDVAELLRRGASPVLSSPHFSAGQGLSALSVANVNDDSIPDLIGEGVSGVSVLLGNGDGTFREPLLSEGTGAGVQVVDVDQDGTLDLVGVSFQSISVLRGNRDGTFGGPIAFSAGDGQPRSVVVVDVNADGRLDAVTVNLITNDLSVLLGKGAGAFAPARRFGVEPEIPKSLVVRDVNADGLPDLVVANDGTGDVTVLVAVAGGNYRLQERVRIGADLQGIAVEDVNGDGRPDLLALVGSFGNRQALLGNGDGTFQANRSFEVGATPVFVLTADVNGDNRQDVITANSTSGDVSVLLGVGDGTLREQRRFRAGDAPLVAAALDVNRDNRSDLIVLNGGSGDVSVLLGNGDGTFETQRAFPVGDDPDELVIADVNRDGIADLIVPDSGADEVSILLGRAEGTFAERRAFAVGTRPAAVVVADVDGDGFLDLIVPNKGSNDVSVLRGRGDGTFDDQVRLPVGPLPVSAAVTDLDGDGFLDLFTANFGSDDVSVLLGNSDGTFRDEFRVGEVSGASLVVPVSIGPERLPSVAVLGDSDGDTLFLTSDEPGSVSEAHNLFARVADNPFVPAGLDNARRLFELITQDFSADAARAFLNKARGRFPDPPVFDVEADPVGADFPGLSVAVADMNGDGRLDVIAADRFLSTVSVVRDDGVIEPRGRTFTRVTLATALEARATPFRADLDDDGTPDMVVLDDSGAILFRRGLDRTRSLFAPPIRINPDHSARAIALARTLSGPVVVTGEVVYAFNGTTFVETSTDLEGGSPDRLAVADLNGDGLDDVIGVSTRANRIIILFQQEDGAFVVAASLPSGVAPSDVTTADVDGDGQLDVVVSNRSSGDVSVLFNDAGHDFTESARYRAGLSFTTEQRVGEFGHAEPQSLEQPVSLVAGLFNGDRRTDVVVVNQESHRFGTLTGVAGGLANPREDLSFSTSAGARVNARPGQVVARDFNRDGRLDIAVLMEDRGEVWLYRGHGDGSFSLLATAPAGNAPTGLNAEDVNGDRLLDLMVGNGFGDILFLLGNGDGTFRPFVRADQRVPFVATDLNSDGAIDVVLASEGKDRALSQLRDPSRETFTPGAFQRDGTDGLVGPADVALADLDGQNGADLVFANTGSNNVLVYLRTADGSFEETPRSFFAGTSPVALHVGFAPLFGWGCGIVSPEERWIPPVLRSLCAQAHVLLHVVEVRNSSPSHTPLNQKPAQHTPARTAQPPPTKRSKALHVAQLNDDNGDGRIDASDLPDLAVANQGSNDVSVLLGAAGPDGWTLRLGPRLRTGNAGPTEVTSGLLNGDDIPDLVAASREGETASLLPGVGDGFFDDAGGSAWERKRSTRRLLARVPLSILAGGS